MNTLNVLSPIQFELNDECKARIIKLYCQAKRARKQYAELDPKDALRLKPVFDNLFDLLGNLGSFVIAGNGYFTIEGD